MELPDDIIELITSRFVWHCGLKGQNLDIGADAWENHPRGVLDEIYTVDSCRGTCCRIFLHCTEYCTTYTDGRGKKRDLHRETFDLTFADELDPTRLVMIYAPDYFD